MCKSKSHKEGATRAESGQWPSRGGHAGLMRPVNASEQGEWLERRGRAVCGPLEELKFYSKCNRKLLMDVVWERM